MYRCGIQRNGKCITGYGEARVVEDVYNIAVDIKITAWFLDHDAEVLSSEKIGTQVEWS